jgi:hypothetical protein
MVLVVAGLGVKDDEGIGKEIVSLACGDCEVGSRIAAGATQMRPG